MGLIFTGRQIPALLKSESTSRNYLGPVCHFLCVVGDLSNAGEYLIKEHRIDGRDIFLMSSQLKSEFGLHVI